MRLIFPTRSHTLTHTPTHCHAPKTMEVSSLMIQRLVIPQQTLISSVHPHNFMQVLYCAVRLADYLIYISKLRTCQVNQATRLPFNTSRRANERMSVSRAYISNSTRTLHFLICIIKIGATTMETDNNNTLEIGNIIGFINCSILAVCALPREKSGKIGISYTYKQRRKKIDCYVNVGDHAFDIHSFDSRAICHRHTCQSIVSLLCYLNC